jgi:all-trans-retinol 13,14-reductase
LLAASAGGDRWADDALALRRSVGLVALHVGLEGDIAALGAAPATHWFYESWDVDAVWRAPFDRPAPAWSVSFPSLRDPAHRAGRARCHTCEILALVDASDPDPGAARRAPGARRAATWRNNAKRALLAQLLERFPRLADCVRVAEVVLPGAAATGPGATGGLPVTPQRFLSPALRPRTPIAGLYLAGQDVGTPGVIGAAIGGVMAAVTIEPAAWKWAH